MLVLYETPAGFALFKVTDEDKIQSVEDVAEQFATSESAKRILKLKEFKKFEDTEEALSAASSLIDGTLDKGLKKFLKTQCKAKEKLAVVDSKFGAMIKEKTGLPCIFDETVGELFRGIRTHIHDLIKGLDNVNVKDMSVGLAHSLARYKLKFSPDKVDTMIVQAIGLLDDLDKELNTYAMRVKEWYGWHFPELSKIINDNILYSKTVMKMGMRHNATDMEFGDILPEEMERDMKKMAIISMGTEISEGDMGHIKLLATQVLSLSQYRGELFDYLKARMQAIAPNLTVMVGELVGARLIAHSGSLNNLAKQPASTIQILGAEKALFRALKTKKDTPKYGLIYHASLIGQTPTKHKGKMSRVLAAKTALSVRVDALGDGSEPTIGIQDRARVERRLQELEGGVIQSLSTKNNNRQQERYEQPTNLGETYQASADMVLTETEEQKKKREKKEKKEKKKKDKKSKKEKQEDDEEENGVTEENGEEDDGEKKKKKKKDKKKRKEKEETGDEETPKKKKKKKDK